MTLPDFAIVGAPKAGTTALDNLLRRVPGIQMCAVKEPHYFSEDVRPDFGFTPPVRSRAEYEAMWAPAKGRTAVLRGEATPTYLMDPGAARRMAELTPRPRIIVLLRDPRTRALSHFLYHEHRTGRSSRSFSDAIRAEVDAPLIDYHRSYLLEPGYYARHLSRWQELFGPDRVLVLFFDDLVADAGAVLSRCCEFLNVDPPPTSRMELRRHERNVQVDPRWFWTTRIMQSTTLRRAAQTLGLARQATRVARFVFLREAPKARLSDGDSRFLEALYDEDASALLRLLGRDLPWYDGTWVSATSWSDRRGEGDEHSANGPHHSK